MTEPSGAVPGDAVTWRELWDQLTPEVGRPQARWLCETASGVDGDEFLAELDRPATVRMVRHLDDMLARLRGGAPLQYVLGRWAFRRLDLMVDRRVLIPRPETEELVEITLARLDRRATNVCVDLGCGSGAIGLSLAAELPVDRTTVWLTDVSTAALDVARANAAGLGRVAANVRFAHGSWFEALPADLASSVDLLISNPPYVADGDQALEAIVRDHEPHVALFGGADGLDALRIIVPGAMLWLAPGGVLAVEIGAAQADAVRAMALGAGLAGVEIHHDAAGHPRHLLARRP